MDVKVPHGDVVIVVVVVFVVDVGVVAVFIKKEEKN